MFGWYVVILFQVHYVYIVDFNLSSKLVPRFMIECQALTRNNAGPRSVLITQIMLWAELSIVTYIQTLI